MLMLDPKLLRQTIEGYKEVNRITEEERMRRLQSMTTEESKAIYDSLCEIYFSHFSKEEYEKLEPLRIEFLVRRRQLFDKVSRLMKERERSRG